MGDTATTTTTAKPAGDADLPAGIQRVHVNGIDLAYETFGNPEDPAILLVMGLGTQMIAWPVELCEALAAAGHHVIRFDNRDVGLSTHMDTPPPSIPQMLLRRNPPYHVEDMASDAFGLVDALGIRRFHLVGVSMGGFIAQAMALRSPDRLRSLTLLMTSTGSRRVGRPTPAVIRRMATASAPASREAAQEDAVTTYGVIGSPGHFDEDKVRELAGIAYDRSDDRDGRQRQLAAILAQPDRTKALRKLRVPTLVVHGLHDPLVAASGGVALATAIPGAMFVGHHGMGHDLPHSKWREVTDDILSLIARVDASSTAPASS